MLRKYYALLFLLGLFLVACGATTPPQVDPQAAPAEEAAPHTTEPAAEVMPVAAKPQLIEFYADW